jgi:branched-chain amino acid transport system substrate-binding protein
MSEKTKLPGSKSILSTPISRRTFGIAAAGTLAATMAPFNIVRAQSGPLKIGSLLPRSGVQAQIGQSCQRGVDLAAGVLKELGYKVDIEIMNADTESSVDVARSRAEKLISDGAQLLIGAFDSGQTAAIAQVAEQKGVPFVINIGAAPQITEQGYKHVFRVFVTAPQLVTQGLTLMKDVFATTGHTPKTAVFLHLNDTFGQANKAAITALMPRLDMPFKILDTISYDPAAKDLSVEVAKAKGTGADLAMVVTRLNDAILLVREMVKQRWEPMGIMSPGSPGMYEAQFLSTMGKYGDFCISNVPWFNPKTELTQQTVAAFKKKYPNDDPAPHMLNMGFTIEAFIVAADAYQRAKSSNGDQLAAALRTTDIKHRISLGGPITFDAKGQNNSNKSASIQNRGGKPVVVLPKEAAEMAPVFPMPGWGART